MMITTSRYGELDPERVNPIQDGGGGRIPPPQEVFLK